MTNADIIRSMNDEGLAILLYLIDLQCGVLAAGAKWDRASDCLAWLRKPAGEGK